MENKNPDSISDLIDDRTYQLLSKYEILDRKAIRDYNIWKEYHTKTKDLSQQEKIMRLSLQHNIKYETIKKIIYTKYEG